MKKLIIALSGLCLASQALGADPAATRATIEANLQSNVRDAAEVARDTNRKLVQQTYFVFTISSFFAFFVSCDAGAV